MRAAVDEILQALLVPDLEVLKKVKLCNGYTKKFTSMGFRYEESFGTDVGRVARD